MFSHHNHNNKLIKRNHLQATPVNLGRFWSSREASLEDVNKVTPDIVKKAAHKLKSGKSDPSFSFSSDCLKNAPDNVFVCLSEIVQGFLVHGHVTIGLLVSTLIPLVKDPLSSMNTSKNYCSVCLSSLLIKMIDWIVIILGD